jgi:hypothetical protein
MITPELLKITNKYNEINNIKEELLKYLNNDTLETDKFLRLDNNNDEDIIKNMNISNTSMNSSNNYSIEPILKNMINAYDKFKLEFNKKQDLLYKTEKELKEAINHNNSDIKIIESLLDKTCILSKDYMKENDKDNEILIDKMIELSKYIKENNKINEIKNRYMKSRKDVIEYMEVVKYINNYNIGSTCSLCLSNSVDSYYEPCGHTICSKCANKRNEYEGVYYKCVYCRKDITSVKKLYLQ